MAYVEPDYETDDTDTEDENPNIKQLRAQAKEAKKLREENEKLLGIQRENAFLRAQVDLDTPLGKLFAKAYDGDLTTEAITAAYAELGGAAPVDGDEIPADEQAATDALRALSSNSSGDTGETPQTPVRGADGRAAKTARDALASGASREDALGVAFHELVAAAADGDGSVIIPSRPME